MSSSPSHSLYTSFNFVYKGMKAFDGSAWGRKRKNMSRTHPLHSSLIEGGRVAIYVEEVRQALSKLVIVGSGGRDIDEHETL